MFSMILKMSALVILYTLLTVLLWKFFQKKTLKLHHKLFIGIVYGICSILSTHFGVDYSDMMINVRDLGPLSAGLFFDPLGGILAGLIGGIERYIAGTYWGVGSYTRIACSVSTCLAGFVAALLRTYIFRGKKPSVGYAFFMGAVMEVFHMYVVFVTHRDDMNMAFYVVKTCAPPMIIFSGIGMVLSSVALQVCTGEWRNPLRKVPDEEIPISHKFRVRLFAVTAVILTFTLFFSYAMQTETAVQKSRAELANVSSDISSTYLKLRQTEANNKALLRESARIQATAVARSVEHMGGAKNADQAFLDSMRDVYSMVSVGIIDENFDIVSSSGEMSVHRQLVTQLLHGSSESAAINPSESTIAAGARCGEHVVQIVIDKARLTTFLNLSELDSAITNYHVGADGSADIFESDGKITAGNHMGSSFSDEDLALFQEQGLGKYFTTTIFDEESLCYIRQLDKGLTLFTRLPLSEVYSNRDAQSYETALADIMLFAVIYVLISMLVQSIVVNNLTMVNASLDRITNGDLDEVVSVRDSSEFASLSNDINQTVTVLKGYIDAAEKRIEQELLFAHNIQDSALPKNFIFPREDFTIYATMDPAKEVGGDFYDFFFAGTDRLALVVADVSGKGIPASLFMMRAKTAIRGFAESGRTPAEILEKANNTLCEGNDAEMFVTVWIGIIDLSSGEMKCANAGHEYPVIMREGGEYELYKDKHGFVLAGMEGMSYKEYVLQFEPGDRLFVYTDGIPEAINANEEQYGTDRLVEILNKTARESSMEEALPAVRKDISDFAGDAEQFDDITMLGFVYLGNAQ